MCQLPSPAPRCTRLRQKGRGRPATVIDHAAPNHRRGPSRGRRPPLHPKTIAPGASAAAPSALLVIDWLHEVIGRPASTTGGPRRSPVCHTKIAWWQIHVRSPGGRLIPFPLGIRNRTGQSGRASLRLDPPLAVLASMTSISRRRRASAAACGHLFIVDQRSFHVGKNGFQFRENTVPLPRLPRRFFSFASRP